ncbi:hypothetical protein BS78_04G217700 [Paspalum vaginatum]|nr:hypothetical protein BS78_04G217700 [Paspalum vaginatum]
MSQPFDLCPGHRAYPPHALTPLVALTHHAPRFRVPVAPRTRPTGRRAPALPTSASPPPPLAPLQAATLTGIPHSPSHPSRPAARAPSPASPRRDTRSSATGPRPAGPARRPPPASPAPHDSRCRAPPLRTTPAAGGPDLDFLKPQARRGAAYRCPPPTAPTSASSALRPTAAPPADTRRRPPLPRLPQRSGPPRRRLQTSAFGRPDLDFLRAQARRGAACRLPPPATRARVPCTLSPTDASS